jgi:hypothetical protein
VNIGEPHPLDIPDYLKVANRHKPFNALPRSALQQREAKKPIATVAGRVMTAHSSEVAAVESAPNVPSGTILCKCRGRSMGATVSEVRRIPIDAIKVDPAVQQRVNGTSEEVVGEYAQAMSDGATFPPAVVFNDGGGNYYLADGFHRMEAYRLAHSDVDEIECEVHPGNRNDALLFACGANAGLRRSPSDQRKAVTTLLRSETWEQWSDREIGRRCKVSPTLVAKVRKDVSANAFIDVGRRVEERTEDSLLSPQQDKTEAHAIAPDRRRIVKRGGRQYTMKTGGIGVGRATAHEPAAPRLPLTSLAWSDATKAERRKFVDGVGVRPIVDILKLMPGFDLLNWAWKVAGQAGRQAFANEHHEQINALAHGERRREIFIPPPASADQCSARG